MKISAEELAARYRSMADEELLEIDRGDLTDIARRCYDAEIERRKIEAAEAAQAGVSESHLPEMEGHWACAGAFRSPEEAQIVRGLLDSAGVPARLDDNPGDLLWLGASSFTSTRVLVPSTMVVEAQGLIESHASAQELEARTAAEPAPVWILARYEDGAFVPLDPVELDEGAEVEVKLPPATK